MELGESLEKIIQHRATGNRVATFRVEVIQAQSPQGKPKTDKTGEPVPEPKFSMTFHQNYVVQLSEGEFDRLTEEWNSFRERHR